MGTVPEASGGEQAPIVAAEGWLRRAGDSYVGIVGRGQAAWRHQS